MRWRGATSAGLAVAVAIGACGGSSGLTAAQFADRADVICKKAHDLVSLATKPSDMPSLAKWVDVVALEALDEARQLKALPQPGKKQDRSAAAAFAESVVSFGGAAQALKGAAERDQIAAVGTRAGQASAGARAASDRAQAIEFAECGNWERDAAAVIDADATTAAKGSFIAKANAICKRTDDAIRAVPKGTTLPQYGQALDTIIPIADQQVKELKALEQPAGDAAAIDEVIALEEQQVAILRQLQPVARRGDQKAGEALAVQGGALVGQINAKADAYGMKECGSANS